MKKLNNTSYRPVNHCIYCGSTENLTKEHILPFGLNGSSTLPKASCKKCAKITGEIERKLLRGEFRPVRIYKKLRSRSKHKDAPKTASITLKVGGIEKTIRLPLEEYPIILNFPKFGAPTILTNEPLNFGINMTGNVCISYGPKPEEVLKKYHANEIRISSSQDPVSFARMIAKIAYSFAYAEGEIDKIIKPSPLLPELLNQNGSIGKYVGTLDKPLERHDGILHRLLVHTDEEKGMLIGEVQLFSDSETPCYGVILGRLKNAT